MKIAPPVILGLWPIAGVTTMGVTENDIHETMQSAIESGIRAFDTAFSYGYDGISDRIAGRYANADRNAFQVIGKIGQRWTADRKRVVDGSPQTIACDAEESLRRMDTEYFDLLMLHSVDPSVSIERSAEAIEGLRQRGLCRNVGVCNVTLNQLQRFASVTTCTAIQCPLNVLQQDSLDDLIPYCIKNRIDVHVYWTLMKGLLAGQITRDHQFDPGDSRPNYPVFQGEARERAHRIVDRFAELATAYDTTVAAIATGWTLAQPGVTASLVGARKPYQIKQAAAAGPLPQELLDQVNQAIDVV